MKSINHEKKATARCKCGPGMKTIVLMVRETDQQTQGEHCVHAITLTRTLTGLGSRVCHISEFLFNDTSINVGHFLSSPKEREKMDRSASR